MCFVGYIGNSCSSCSVGYVRHPRTGECVLLAGTLVSCEDNMHNGDETGVDCGGLQCPACAATSGRVYVMLGGGLGALGVVIGAVLMYLRKRPLDGGVLAQTAAMLKHKQQRMKRSLNADGKSKGSKQNSVVPECDASSQGAAVTQREGRSSVSTVVPLTASVVVDWEKYVTQESPPRTRTSTLAKRAVEQPAIYVNE